MTCTASLLITHPARDIGTNYVVTEKTEHTWGINVPGISTAVAAVILIAAAHEYNLV